MKNPLLILVGIIMIACSTSAFAEIVVKAENYDPVTKEASSYLKIVKLPAERSGLYYEHLSPNLANGTYETYHTNGQLRYKGFYKRGIMEGIHQKYTGDGKLWFRETYKDSIKNGTFLHQVGQVGMGYFRTGFYKNGLKDGIIETYSKDGTLMSKCFYVKSEKYECEVDNPVPYF